MSYDLFLGPRKGKIEHVQFENYLRSRKHYELDGREMLYSNPDTGIYFAFAFSSMPSPPDEQSLPISFEINFYRPSYFILEAEREVTALVRQFDLIVFDPQRDGMKDEEYQSSLLIKGWNRGNELAFASFLRGRNAAADVVTLPAATLVEAWRWNFARADRQAQIGDDKFVPRILFLRIGQETRSAAVWPEAIASVIPRVDYLIVLRAKPESEDAEDKALVAFETVRPLLESHGSFGSDGSVDLNYGPVPPQEVALFVETLPRHTGEFLILRPDEVLDRELMDKYSADQPPGGP